jgi:hypothetical protein
MSDHDSVGPAATVAPTAVGAAATGTTSAGSR